MAVDLENIQEFSASGIWRASAGRTARVTAYDHIDITYVPDYTADDCSLFFYQRGGSTLKINGQAVLVNLNESVTLIRLYWDGQTLIINSDYQTASAGGANGYVQ